MPANIRIYLEDDEKLIGYADGSDCSLTWGVSYWKRISNILASNGKSYKAEIMLGDDTWMFEIDLSRPGAYKLIKYEGIDIEVEIEFGQARGDRRQKAVRESYRKIMMKTKPNCILKLNQNIMVNCDFYDFKTWDDDPTIYRLYLHATEEKLRTPLPR